MLLRFAAENATEVPPNVASAIAASNAAVSTLLEAAQTPGARYRLTPFTATTVNFAYFSPSLCAAMYSGE